MALAKNALLIENDLDNNDNLAKMTRTNLEEILNHTYPKHIIMSPCTGNELPEIVYCSGSDGGLRSINNVAIGASAFSFGPNSGAEGVSRI